MSKYQPDEYYNLAAQSHVVTSFDQPVHTFDVNANGVLYALEAIRKFSPETRFYQASTSEMFGSNFSCEAAIEYEDDVPPKDNNGDKGMSVSLRKFQDEETPLSPNSPYAVAKVAAHNLVSLYRRSYNVHASAGILFNHEGERRGENFVTRKMTKYVARLYHHRNSLAGLRGGAEYETLKLGNLDAQRDWGYAPDYVEAMYLMLQQDIPDDYVICTGRAYSVRDFLTASFKCIGIQDWSKYVEIDPQFYRPCEVEFLRGDSSKARRVLGWEPKTSFEMLVRKMMQADANAPQL